MRYRRFCQRGKHFLDAPHFHFIAGKEGPGCAEYLAFSSAMLRTSKNPVKDCLVVMEFNDRYASVDFIRAKKRPENRASVK